MAKWTPEESQFAGFSLRAFNGKYLSFDQGIIECDAVEVGLGQTFNAEEIFKRV
jgi:hypothetical protein